MRTSRKTYFPELEALCADRKREQQDAAFLRAMGVLVLAFIGCALIEAWWR